MALVFGIFGVASWGTPVFGRAAAANFDHEG
jgi:hypothetical protein